MNNAFTKRIYTPKLFVKDTLFIIRSIPALPGMMRNPAMNKAFIEKIMMVVTAVNGCAYCSWFHAKQSLAAGLSEKEIQNLLKLQFQADSTAFELPALLYAQHYTEMNRTPEPQMQQYLSAAYDAKTVEHIHIVIRLIYFGNLDGNTFDAFLSRLRGKKAKDSSLLFEIFMFSWNLPFLLPILPLTRKFR